MNSTLATGDSLRGRLLRAEEYAQIRPMPDAIEILKRLQEKRYGYPEIHIISRVVDPHVGAMCNRWIDQQPGLSEIVPRERRHFCNHRESKKGICLELGAQIMIDNTLDVLRHMVGRVRNLILFRPSDEEESARHWRLVNTGKVTLVDSWDDIAEIL
ncbi:MAG: hypothetical protein EXS59_02555 [Candidatus Taylorbacteria bacterium]|nr:hypothetical protein [Candidatus Taylorbacteria bacterium]